MTDIIVPEAPSDAMIEAALRALENKPPGISLGLYLPEIIRQANAAGAFSPVKDLTRLQRRFYEFLEENSDEAGWCLLTREQMRLQLNAYPSLVHRWIVALEEKGHIKRSPSKRGLIVKKGIANVKHQRPPVKRISQGKPGKGSGISTPLGDKKPAQTTRPPGG